MVLRRIFTTLLCGLLAALTVTAWPVHASADTPEAVVQELLETIQKIKKEAALSPEEVDRNHRQMDRAIAHFDVTEVSRKALGKHWDKQTPQDQNAFVDRLSELLKYVAFPNSSKFFRDLDIGYKTGAQEGASATVVVTVHHLEEGQIILEFLMNSASGRWRAVDVILDGISMRNNLRTQFTQVLKKKPFAELMRTMEKRIHKAKRDNDSGK